MRSLPIEDLTGPRADLMRCVRGSPGIHLRAIERESRLALGQVLYHLDRLERMGLVVAARDAGFKRYFASQDVGRKDKRYLGALRPELPRRIILTLLADGPLNHKALQERLGIAASTLSFHLQRLVTAGIVVRARSGASNRYQAAEPDVLRRELIFFRESFRDPEVDRYVRAELERAPVPS